LPIASLAICVTVGRQPGIDGEANEPYCCPLCCARILAMPRRFTSALSLLFAVTALLIGEAPVAAQVLATPGFSSIYTPSPTPADQRDPTGPVGVLLRQRPELQPEGFWVEGLHLLPSASVATIYDSNIFATQSNPASDVVLHLRPELNADNGPGLIRYNLNVYGDIVRYASHESLDNPNFGTTLGIVGDLASTLRVESRTSFLYDHSDPASFVLPTANGTLTRLPVHHLIGEQVSVIRDIGRWGLGLGGGYRRETFENITINGVTFEQSQLNSNVFDVSPKVTYDLTPLLRGVVRGEYRHETDAAGILNSSTYTVVTGVDFEFRRLFRGTATVGYREHVHDSSAFGSVGSITYGLDLAWYPSEIVTVTLTGNQDFSDTILTGARGTPAVTDVKTVQAQVDCEVLRQVVLSGIVSYENDDYQSTTRRDDATSAGANLVYTINRYWIASTQYRYVTRKSTQPGFSYDRHQAGVVFKLQF